MFRLYHFIDPFEGRNLGVVAHVEGATTPEDLWSPEFRAVVEQVNALPVFTDAAQAIEALRKIDMHGYPFSVRDFTQEWT